MTVLVLYPNAWDKGELARDKYRRRQDFVFEGYDLFKFPGLLRLASFDPRRTVDRLARKYRGARLEGVMSSDEYLGAAMASMLGGALGLPHRDPRIVLTCQNKLASRRAQRAIVPEAVPEFARVPLGTRRPGIPMRYPLFAKPVKGACSLLARRVDDPDELSRFLDFSPLEALAFGRVAAAFAKLARAYPGLDEGAGDFIAESLLEGVQATVDGFVFDGRVTTMGVVDSVMVPGTNAFLRFDYPSRLVPAPVEARMRDIAARLVLGLGMRHGQFNVELFWDERTDCVSIIEINPRLSYQFADLYEKVDGTSSYDVLLDLTLGREPLFRPRNGRHGFASSFVLRTFQKGRLPAPPSPADRRAVLERYPDARLRIYAQAGSMIATEIRASGSYCYGVMNLGARSAGDLFAAYDDVLDRLRLSPRASRGGLGAAFISSPPPGTP
jgi:hypothetical protein